jgi:RHS repeat-associated protein
MKNFRAPFWIKAVLYIVALLCCLSTAQIANADVAQIHVSIFNNNNCEKSIAIYLRRPSSCNGEDPIPNWVAQQPGIPAYPGQMFTYDYVSQDNPGNCGIVWKVTESNIPYDGVETTIMPESASNPDRFNATIGPMDASSCNNDVDPGQDDPDSTPSDPLCKGMPTWSVSEPNIGLWITDEPMGYQPAVGPRIALDLAFKQRGVAEGTNPNIFSFGKKWNSSWLSYLVNLGPGESTTNYALRGAGFIGVEAARVGGPSGGGTSSGGARSSGGGGRRTFYGVISSGVFTPSVPPAPSDIDYYSNTRMSGDKNNGFTVSYPDGSVDYYGFVVTNSLGTFRNAFLSARWTANGQRTRLDYYDYLPGNNPVIRLKCVVDGDNRTNWVYYVPSNGFSTNLISYIVDPFGHTNSFAYDDSGHLTNMVDVVGISSSFTYDANSCVTNMVTPYGTNSFEIVDVPGTSLQPVDVSRSILVTEADGSKQLYLYTNNAPGVSSSYSSDQIPNVSPFGNTFDVTNLNLRTSFHWNRKQYAALSTTTISSFTADDFRKARMKHWLKDNYDKFSSTLSMEREPSPDSGGVAEGQKTWYDYSGKTLTSTRGTQINPLVVAQVLPDGTTRFSRTERNVWGSATNEVTTYSIGSTVGLRTNTFTFAVNAIDIVAITNALGTLVSSNIYDPFHEVLTNYNALNEMATFIYDTSHRLVSATAPSGLVTTNLYGADGFLAQQIAVGFSTNSYTWINDLLFTQTDPRNLTITNTWDPLERLRRVDYPDGTSATNSYDRLDQVRVVDRMGFTNSFGYNAVRQLVAATNANGVVARYGYCSCGALESITNAFGTALQQVTQNTYDLQGNIIQVQFADGFTVTYNFNALAQATNVTDGTTSVTNWFNNQGLQVAVSNAFGRVETVAYDILDRAVTNVDANSVSITTTYDTLNRVRTHGYPDGGLESFGYSVNLPGLTSYTNQLNQVAQYGYDIAGRKISETNANLEVTQFSYSGAGDMLTLSDGKNQTTGWSYDSFGRVTNKVDAANNLLFVYNYDPDNRLTNRWSVAKGTTTYRYDALGNPTNVTYPVSPAVSMSYDVLNRMTDMVDAVGTTRYTYDTVGELLSEDGPWSSDVVNYTYANRLRTGLSVSAPNASAWSQSYGYDAARRLTSITSPAGLFGYTYKADQALGVSRLSLPNSAYITNTFDSVARLTATILKNGGGTLLNAHQYAYNLGNQRTQQVFTAGNTMDYTYDSIGQLTSAFGKEAGGVTNREQEKLSYVYDAAGNLMYRTNNALVQTFNVNNLNELSTVSRVGTFTVAGVTTSPATNVTVNTFTATLYSDNTFAGTNFPLADGNKTYTAIAKDAYGRQDTNTITVSLPQTNSYSYDLNGNLISDGKRVFEYDDENQLTAVWKTNAWRSEFSYDGRMRRRIQKDYSWSGSGWTQTNEVHFIYDGNLVIQERDTNNLPEVTYTRGRDLSGSREGVGGIGGLLARTENLTLNTATSSAYYHCDGIGSITCLISTNQIVVARYAYDAFGNTLAISGPLAQANHYRFSSKEYHANSGLVYYLYRYYEPNLQRWINRDPIGEWGGVNLFQFVCNDPANMVDFLGLVDCAALKRAIARMTADARDAIHSLNDADDMFREAMVQQKWGFYVGDVAGGVATVDSLVKDLAASAIRTAPHLIPAADGTMWTVTKGGKLVKQGWVPFQRVVAAASIDRQTEAIAIGFVEGSKEVRKEILNNAISPLGWISNPAEKAAEEEDEFGVTMSENTYDNLRQLQALLRDLRSQYNESCCP